MSGQTALSRKLRRMRPPVDQQAKRYFVYTLVDEAGEPVYIGRSCNVANRLRAHYGEATHPFNPARAAKAEWLVKVRSLSMTGPYTWREAVAEERRQIETHQPLGNVALTDRARRRAS